MARIHDTQWPPLPGVGFVLHRHTLSDAGDSGDIDQRAITGCLALVLPWAFREQNLSRSLAVSEARSNIALIDNQHILINPIRGTGMGAIVFLQQIFPRAFPKQTAWLSVSPNRVVFDVSSLLPTRCLSTPCRRIQSFDFLVLFVLLAVLLGGIFTSRICRPRRPGPNLRR
jgi:hypothetical protein